MTPEVKQRIEQIRQGIVPEGYKKTKTDIVPADWKESPVGEYIREYTEKTTIPNQYPVLTSARTGLMLQTDYYSNRQVTTEDNVGYNVLPYGYITFRSRSDDGRFRFNENRIIKRGIISYFYPVFSFSEEVCHEYMLYLLNFSIYRRMYPYAEGTAQQVLSLKKLGQLKYSLPPVAEQKKIAEILAMQDKAIELQGRKIEELKRFKKGCLEKMFPRKGQKVPEKRFPEFTNDWEQRKWLDTVDISTEMVDPKTGKYDNLPHVAPGNIESFTGKIYDNVKLVKDENLISGKFHFYDGDIIYGKINPQLGKYVFARFEGLTSADAYVLNAKNGTTQEYLYSILQTKDFYDYSVSVSKRSGMPKINRDELNAYCYLAPSEQEQKQIGTMFLHLDNLITLHQRKLEEMKKQKKALMQLLLTGIVRV